MGSDGEKRIVKTKRRRAHKKGRKRIVRWLHLHSGARGEPPSLVVSIDLGVDMQPYRLLQ